MPSRKLPRPARNGSAQPSSRIRVVSLLYLAAMSLSRSLWERWPSGRRRTPAKGVGIKSPSRVRIPPSPPFTHCRSSLRLDRAAWDFRLGRDFARSRITKKDRAPIDPFSVAEAEALIAALHRDLGEAQGNYDEFRFFTGLRPSEQIALLVPIAISTRAP